VKGKKDITTLLILFFFDLALLARLNLAVLENALVIADGIDAA